MLLARIYEAFPLPCPQCGAEMRIIAFITEAVTVRTILQSIGEPAIPPRIFDHLREIGYMRANCCLTEQCGPSNNHS
jgi:hypothetical protein